MIRSNRTRRATLRQRHLRAAATTSKALTYRTLSGLIAAAVENGRLIRTGDFLQRIGGGHLPDGQQSWYGRHVAKAYRAAHNGQDAPRAWVRHRTTGRWIHVFVYSPTDPALITGLRTYKATASLISQASFTEAA